MSFEGPTTSSAEKAEEKPKESKSELQPKSKVEVAPRGVKPADISEFGEVKLHGTSATGNIEASHIVVEVATKNVEKFFKGRAPEAYYGGFAGKATLEKPASGKVKNLETGLTEDYRYTYVEGPDGKVSAKKVESDFSDGAKEVLEREFDDSGRVIRETDALNGKLVREFINKYDDEGKFVEQIVRDYDENEKIISEKPYKGAAIMSGKRYLDKDLPGRSLL